MSVPIASDGEQSEKVSLPSLGLSLSSSLPELPRVLESSLGHNNRDLQKKEKRRPIHFKSRALRCEVSLSEAVPETPRKCALDSQTLDICLQLFDEVAEELPMRLAPVYGRLKRLMMNCIFSERIDPATNRQQTYCELASSLAQDKALYDSDRRKLEEHIRKLTDSVKTLEDRNTLLRSSVDPKLLVEREAKFKDELARVRTELSLKNQECVQLQNFLQRLTADDVNEVMNRNDRLQVYSLQLKMMQAEKEIARLQGELTNLQAEMDTMVPKVQLDYSYQEMGRLEQRLKNAERKYDEALIESREREARHLEVETNLINSLDALKRRLSSSKSSRSFKVADLPEGGGPWNHRSRGNSLSIEEEPKEPQVKSDQLLDRPPTSERNSPLSSRPQSPSTTTIATESRPATTSLSSDAVVRTEPNHVSNGHRDSRPASNERTTLTSTNSRMVANNERTGSRPASRVSQSDSRPPSNQSHAAPRKGVFPSIGQWGTALKGEEQSHKEDLHNMVSVEDLGPHPSQQQQQHSDHIS